MAENLEEVGKRVPHAALFLTLIGGSIVAAGGAKVLHDRLQANQTDAARLEADLAIASALKDDRLLQTAQGRRVLRVAGALALEEGGPIPEMQIAETTGLPHYILSSSVDYLRRIKLADRQRQRSGPDLISAMPPLLLAAERPHDFQALDEAIQLLKGPQPTG